MELLHKLNAISSLEVGPERKPFRKMYELNIDEKYPVTEIKQITTRFGDKIVVQLHDCLVSLPQRCEKVASDYLKLNEEKPLFFVYLGTKECGKKMAAQMFKFEK